MPDIQVDVRQARRNDIERINLLLDQARRACVRFGYEDLVHMIDHDFCYVAETGALLWGFICASVRQPGLAHLRGLGLINGWRVDGGIERLLQTLEADLQREKVSDLLYLATEILADVAAPAPGLLHPGLHHHLRAQRPRFSLTPRPPGARRSGATIETRRTQRPRRPRSQRLCLALAIL